MGGGAFIGRGRLLGILRYKLDKVYDLKKDHIQGYIGKGSCFDARCLLLTAHSVVSL